MEVVIFLSRSISSITFFTSRPFLSALCVAIFGRIGLAISQGDVTTNLSIAGMDFLSSGNAADIPWVLSNLALLIFFILTLLEYGASLSADLASLYSKALWIVQPGSAFVVNYSYADYEYTYFVEALSQLLPAHTLVAALPATHDLTSIVLSGTTVPNTAAQTAQAGWLASVFVLSWAVLIAFGTWLLGRLRAVVVGAINGLDEDNSLGLKSILRWTENSWVAVGMFLVVFAPIAALVMSGLTLACLFLLRIYFNAREHRTLIPCPHCARLIHPSAFVCPYCQHRHEQPRNVGLFGQAKNTVVTNSAAHRLHLIARKRCPLCATRLKVRAAQQKCQQCGTVTFSDISAVNTYLRSLDKLLPKTLIVCFCFGLLPLVGLVPGIIYYRLSLVASLSSYLPAARGCMTRWLVRGLSLVLLALQPIPLVGAFMLPLLCALNYGVYRSTLHKYCANKLHRTFDPVAHPAVGQQAQSQAMPAQLPPVSPTTVGAPFEDRRCSTCHATVPPEHHFCTACGTKLN